MLFAQPAYAGVQRCLPCRTSQRILARFYVRTGQSILIERHTRVIRPERCRVQLDRSHQNRDGRGRFSARPIRTRQPDQVGRKLALILEACHGALLQLNRLGILPDQQVQVAERFERLHNARPGVLVVDREPEFSFRLHVPALRSRSPAGRKVHVETRKLLRCKGMRNGEQS